MTQREIYQTVGLIVTEGYKYSEDLARIFVDEGSAATGIPPHEFKARHVREIPAENIAAAERALAQFVDYKYTLFSALGDFNVFLNPDRAVFKPSDGVVTRHNIVVLEEGFGKFRLPTAYRVGTLRSGHTDGHGLVEANVYSTSYEFENSDRFVRDEFYTAGQTPETLSYLQTIRRLEPMRDVSEAAGLLGLAEYISPHYGNQGFEPVTTRYFTSNYRKDLYGVTGIDGYGVLGYVTVPLDRDYEVVYHFSTFDLRGARGTVLRQDEHGRIRYLGIYNQGMIVPYADIRKFKLAIPVYGHFICLGRGDRVC